jgi:Mn-dependent DtxR family transcriptional regulator
MYLVHFWKKNFLGKVKERTVELSDYGLKAAFPEIRSQKIFENFEVNQMILKGHNRQITITKGEAK